MDYDTFLLRVEQDPDWAAQVRYCARAGIPLTRFLGGPDVWTEHDRVVALLQQRMDGETCDRCGTRAAEWDPAQGGDPHAYRAVPERDRGCEVLEQGLALLPKGEQGVKVWLVRDLDDDETDEAEVAAHG